MSWSILQDVPNPHIDANGDPYSGAVLKAYLPGTTTSTSIAIDSSGTSPQASITYNAEGKLEVSGNEILPYIDRKCKWAIFANSTDAAANTPFQMGPFDNVDKVSDSGTGLKPFATLAAAVASTTLDDGDALNIAERTSGNGGGGMWDVVLSSTVTENTYNIVQCTGVATLSLVLREELNIVIASQWGIVADGALTAGTGTDNTTTLQYIIDNVETFGVVVKLPCGPIGLGSTINQGASGNQRIKFVGERGLDGTVIFALDGFTGTTLWQLPLLIANTNRVADSEYISIDFSAKSRTDYCMKGFGNTMLFRDCRFRESDVAGTDIRYGYDITYDHCGWKNNNADGCLNVDQNNQVTFLACRFFGSGGVGAEVRGSFAVEFVNCLFEGNDIAGALVSGQGGVTFDACYFEANASTGMVFTTPSATVQADIILQGSSSRTTMATASPARGVHISNPFTSMPRANGSLVYAISAEGLVVDNPVLNVGQSVPVVRAYGSTTTSSQYFRCPDMRIRGASKEFSDYLIVDNSTTSIAGSDGFIFDGVDKLNAAPDDLNAWTSVTGGAGGSWERSGKPHDLGPSIPVWDMVLASSSTSNGYGFAIDPADYPDLQGKPVVFKVSCKAAATNTPTVQIVANGGTHSTTSTTWTDLSAIFTMPTSGSMNIRVNKTGDTGTASFASPAFCELGVDLKTIHRRVPKQGARYNAASGTTTAPTTGTWLIGDDINFPEAAAAGVPKTRCISNGTFSSATDATGDPDGSTAVITGMADTSDFSPGDFVTVSAGMPSTSVPYRIVSVDSATQITLDTASTSSQTDVTIATVDPVFKSFGVLAS